MDSKQYAPSPAAQDVIDRFVASGETEAIAVGECLASIAENGSDMASDAFLVACAGEMMTAAEAFQEGVAPAPKKIVTPSDMRAYVKGLPKEKLVDIVTRLGIFVYSEDGTLPDQPMDRDVEVNGSDCVDEVLGSLAAYGVIPAQGSGDDDWIGYDDDWIGYDDEPIETPKYHIIGQPDFSVDSAPRKGAR